MNSYFVQLAERAFKTGVQFLVAELALLQSTISVDDLGSWAWAFPFVGVALSVVSSLLSRYVGDSDDPSVV